MKEKNDKQNELEALTSREVSVMDFLSEGEVLTDTSDRRGVLVDAEDIIMPRLAIVQPPTRRFTKYPRGSIVETLSEECLWPTEADLKAPSQDLLATFFDESKQAAVPCRPLLFLPILVYPDRTYLSAESGLVCRSLPGGMRPAPGMGFGTDCVDCPNSKWGDDGKPPACSRQIVVLGQLPMSGDIVAVPFAKTSLRVGRSMATMLQLKGPAWRYLWGLSTAKRESEKGVYFIWQTRRLGPTSEALLPLAEELHNTLNPVLPKVTMDSRPETVEEVAPWENGEVA